MKPIFDREPPMRVAGFMSGEGTNLIKIIEWGNVLKKEKGSSPYEVIMVFSDKKQSNAASIAKKFGIAFECLDIMDFYWSKGCSTKTDLAIRQEFDSNVVDVIEKYVIDVIALAGYMNVVTKPLLERYDNKIINVHPADLTILENGRRKYTGFNVVERAIAAGEKTIRATTHIVREDVDCGEILMVSRPIDIKLDEPLDELLKNKNKLHKSALKNQERLKVDGDWLIYPCTLRMIAEGRYAVDSRRVYVDGIYMPDGYQLP